VVVSVTKGPLASQLVACLRPPQLAHHTFAGSMLRLLDKESLPFDASEWLRRCDDRAQSLLTISMVPSTYVIMKGLPLSAAGKADRKALREWLEVIGESDVDTVNRYQPAHPAFNQSPASKTDIAPQEHDWQQQDMVSAITDEIRRLILQPRRPLGDFARTIPFRRIGLYSITIVPLLTWLNQTYHANISMHTLLRLGTIQRLVSHLCSSSMAQQDDTALANETRPGLQNEERENLLQILNDGVSSLCTDNYLTEAPAFRRILLTGGNGYVGLHILREILQRLHTTRVVILLRTEDAMAGKARLLERARRLGGAWETSWDERIEVWPGDLGQKSLGLQAQHWEMLADKRPRQYGDDANIDGIIHNGAVVDWFLGFEALRAVNIDASLTLAKCARDSRFIHRMIYISGVPQWETEDDDLDNGKLMTTSAPAGWPIGPGDAFWRSMVQSNPYRQTKLLTSHILLTAASFKSTLARKVGVLRPALIIGSTSYGVPNVDDFIWRVVRGCCALGSYPREDPNGWVYLCGGDAFAGMVVDQLCQPADQATVGMKRESKVENGLPVQAFWATVCDIVPRPGGLEALNPALWL
jgi:thioester reductase-like protein